MSLASPGVPAVEIVHRHPRFVFTLQVCPSQRRDVLLLRFRLEGDASLRPYALLSARLGGDAANNVASVGDHNGRTALWAEQGPFGLALLAVDEHGRRRVAARFGRLRRGERRLAGFPSQRAHDLALTTSPAPARWR